MNPEHSESGYEANEHWAKLPPGWSWTEVAGVANDSQDCVFVFNRGEHPVIVFDRDGNFLRSWGEGVFARPHGITIGQMTLITPSGNLLLRDICFGHLGRAANLPTPARPASTFVPSATPGCLSTSLPMSHSPPTAKSMSAMGTAMLVFTSSQRMEN